jgi:3-dehydrosphinganine reductase
MFEGTGVVIAGGSSGIGLATAELLAARGANVGIIGRDAGKLAAAVGRIEAARRQPSQIVASASADLSDEAATRAAFDELADAGIDPEILINSAGVIIPGEFVTMSSGDFESNMTSGFWSVVNPCRVVAPQMAKRGRGHIVNVSSVAGYLGIYGYTGYSAAKYATMGFTEALRFEMLPLGVHVHVVCPPDTDTPALAHEKTLRPPETDVVAGNIKAIPPAKVAEAIVRGIEKDKYYIIPDALSSFYFRLKGVLPEVFFAIVDGDVKKAQSRKPARELL